MGEKMTHTSSNNAFFFLCCAFLANFCFNGAKGVERNAPVTVDVGIIRRNASSNVDMRIMSCINMSLIDFYEKNGNYSTRLFLKIRNSEGEVVSAAAAALDLIKYEQVQAIISPPTSMETTFVKALGETAKVPIITFSATDPSLTSVRSNYFFRATQNDSTQTGVISALMEAFQWRQAVPIYVDNEFGQGILPYLAEALEDVRASIPFHCPIPLNSTDDEIDAALSHLKTNLSTRVFIVHMDRLLGKKMFARAKRLGMMSEGYAWILTDTITDIIDSLNSSDFSSMQGVVGVRPYVKRDKKLLDFERRWKAKYRRDQKLDIYSLYGSDTVTALAIAVERLGVQYFSQKSAKLPGYSKDLTEIPVSVNGSQLVDALSNVNFSGLSGSFRFVNGQLPPATYEIVNINGDGYKGIELWTPGQGLGSGKNFNRSRNASSSLSLITWPGNSSDAPKGWELPIGNKKLKIVIPSKEKENPFVKNGSGNATGFCIEVFRAVVAALPYSLDYEFSLFVHPNNTSRGTYNDMIYQVKLGEYDAAVGDITILANRSQFVDFTMPYTESGVSIVVPSTYGNRNDPWIFLTPLTRKLWIACLGCFLGFGIVIWYLERKVNRQFHGPTAQQVGNSLCFSFSTMFFQHSNDVVRNLTRTVVILWCFFVLILVQSFLASLTSLLTVQQLKSATGDLPELIRKKMKVGYSKDSFIRDVLKQLGFDQSNLIGFQKYEECHKFFQNKQIDAAIIETPYLRDFLKKHCNQYAEKHAFETGGFGFVFPVGSPLVPDVSRAILKVVTNVYNSKANGTVNATMNIIQNKWFPPQRDCSAEDFNASFSPLDLNSFMGLFMIIGGTSLLAVAMAAVIDYWKGMPLGRKQRAFKHLFKHLRISRLTPQVPITDLDADPHKLQDPQN